MVYRPCSHLLKEDWPQYLETVRLLFARGGPCPVRMRMLLFGDEVSAGLSIDKLQLALYAGLRDKLKSGAMLQFYLEQRGPCPASEDTCLLRRLMREFPRVHLVPAKLQCLGVVKLLLNMNTRTAINRVLAEISCIYLRGTCPGCFVIVG